MTLCTYHESLNLFINIKFTIMSILRHFASNVLNKLFPPFPQLELVLIGASSKNHPLNNNNSEDPLGSGFMGQLLAVPKSRKSVQKNWLNGAWSNDWYCWHPISTSAFFAAISYPLSTRSPSPPRCTLLRLTWP